MFTLLKHCFLFTFVYFGVPVVELRGLGVGGYSSSSLLSSYFSWSNHKSVKRQSSQVSKNVFREKYESFSYFTFTQAWPTSVCIQGVDLNHTCDKVLNETGWTIHGLWPSSVGNSSTQPENCNKTAKFNPDAISKLVNDLNKYWPNLYKDTLPDDFWKHEWMKHGTCALNVSKTANEYLYFLQGLTLFKQINLTHVMEQFNYHPNDNKTLNVKKLLIDLKTKFNGVAPIIGCYKSEKDHKFYLDQIEVCYSKTFEMFDCLKKRPKTLFFKSLKKHLIMNDAHLEGCSKDGLAYYPTIPK